MGGELPCYRNPVDMKNLYRNNKIKKEISLQSFFLGRGQTQVKCAHMKFVDVRGKSFGVSLSIVLVRT